MLILIYRLWRTRTKVRKEKLSLLQLISLILNIRWLSRFVGISILISSWRKTARIGILDGLMGLSVSRCWVNCSRIRKLITFQGWVPFPGRIIWLRIWPRCKLHSHNITITVPGRSFSRVTFMPSKHTTVMLVEGEKGRPLLWNLRQVVKAEEYSCLSPSHVFA